VAWVVGSGVFAQGDLKDTGIVWASVVCAYLHKFLYMMGLS